jgi:hypothetical protein
MYFPLPLPYNSSPVRKASSHWSCARVALHDVVYEVF